LKRGAKHENTCQHGVFMLGICGRARRWQGGGGSYHVIIRKLPYLDYVFTILSTSRSGPSLRVTETSPSIYTIFELDTQNSTNRGLCPRRSHHSCPTQNDLVMDVFQVGSGDAGQDRRVSEVGWDADKDLASTSKLRPRCT